MLKKIRKHQKTIALSCLIILVELVYFIYVSFPPSLLYSLRKNSENLLVSLTPTHKAKAKIYLAQSTRLQQHFSHLQTQKANSGDLDIVANELISEEQKAISEMDQAKKGGVNIKNEVEVLCDTLIKQYSVLQQSIAYHTFLKSALNQTKVNLDESSGW